MKLILIYICFSMIFFWELKAQDEEIIPSESELESDNEVSNYDFKGYISFFQQNIMQEKTSQLTSINNLQNRINFRYFPLDEISFVAEMQNHIYWADAQYIDYSEISDNNYQLADLSLEYSNKKNYLLRTNIDRLYIDYNRDDWQIRFGRQRINWGQSYVWNPNDIFNPYSYLDFNYEERPGSDALLVKHYLDINNSMQVAIKFNRDDFSNTFAMLYKTNIYEYEMQFLLGKMEEYNVLGYGLAGQMYGAGIKGEISYFNKNGIKYDQGEILSSLSLDYTLPNSLYFQLEAFLNSGNSFAQNIYDVKEIGTIGMGLGKYSIFFQSAYQLSTLSRISLSVMYSPVAPALIIIPTFSYSISDNAELMMIIQLSRIPHHERLEYVSTNNFSGKFKFSF